MNRVYTFAYLKQPVGRARYVLMTNDAGTIVDDGVACRLAEDRFYVTTTTTGAERVYRTMLWWNAQWRLEVDVANVSVAGAAVNIAGPRARELLARLVGGIDLACRSVPLHGRTQRRRGRHPGTAVPRRLRRRASASRSTSRRAMARRCGMRVFDAGRDLDIAPFGVEAQRLLRLEKGHIIIGQGQRRHDHARGSPI